MYQVLTIPCMGDVSPLKFNATLAAIAGVLFSSGWWIMISLLASNAVNPYEFLPGLCSTVGMVIVNLIPTSLVHQPNLYGHDTCCASLLIRACLLIGFMISFGSLIGACYVLFNDYLLEYDEADKWPGWGVLLQNLCIFLASLLLKCTTPPGY